MPRPPQPTSTLPIIDSHVHTWDLSRQRLPWLADMPEGFRRSFSLSQLTDLYATLPDVDFLGVVHVEADVADPVQEDTIQHELRHSDPRLLATVAAARLGPSMRLPVEAVGIREVLHNADIPRGRCLSEGFLAGLRILGERGLIFDACIRVGELDDLAAAARRVPEATIVLDHLGNVGSLNDEYRAAIHALGELPNVLYKVSGLPVGRPSIVGGAGAAEASRAAGKTLALAEGALSLAEEAFGRDRLLYASNWPVILTYADFAENLRVVRGFFGDDPRIFADNARRVYGIGAA